MTNLHQNITTIHQAMNTPNATKLHFNAAIERNLRWMKLLMEVEVQIIEYAEAYFNLSLAKFNSALFYRAHTILDNGAEKHLAGFNNGEGWLVPIHVDNCRFDQYDWKCVAGVDRLFQKQFSVVLFLNDLAHDDAGGEFVFLDSTVKPAGGLTAEMEAEYESQRKTEGYDRRLRRRAEANDSDESIDDYGTYDFEHLQSGAGRRRDARDIIPPPSRAQIRRALNQQRLDKLDEKRRKLSQNNQQSKLVDSSTREEESTTSIGKFAKVVSVNSANMNYTVVFPRAGRLAIFNSSADNVHAVTQILNENDRRYTLFMFLRVRTISF